MSDNVAREIRYKDRKVEVAKGYGDRGVSEVGIFYDFVQNQFYFKGETGVTKRLGNSAFSEQPIILTNPKFEFSLASKNDVSLYRYNTESTTYIKLNSDIVSNLGYDLENVLIDTIAFPINDFGSFGRAESSFRFSNIKLFVVNEENTLAGDWSELSANELRDAVLEQTPTYQLTNQNVKPNSQNWVNYESKDYYRFNVPNFIYTSSKTIVITFTVVNITDLKGFDSSIIGIETTTPCVGYNSLNDGQVITNQFWIPLIFNI